MWYVGVPGLVVDYGNGPYCSLILLLSSLSSYCPAIPDDVDLPLLIVSIVYALY